MPAFAKKLGSRLPSDLDRKAANQLRRILAAQKGGTLRFLEDDQHPSEIALTPGLSALLTEMLRHIGSGDAVTLVPVSRMLSTQQAADIRNISRPFLISLLEKGAIPHTHVGRHRRIKAVDLFAYKEARDERRSKALDDLAALDSAMI